MIEISKIRLQRGHKVLLQNASISIHAKQKVGLIGANGTGKSSLFKLLLGEIDSDEGELRIPSQWSLSHMAQEIVASSGSALDYVLAGDAPLQQVQQQIAELTARPEPDANTQLAQLYAELEAIDGYAAEARAQKLLRGLNFSTGDDQRPVNEFSGGWRIRLNLARALMCRSDLLLLDEPTNHLDLDATLWLEQWLKQYPGTLLIISHDRDFLDNTVNQIVSVEQQTLNAYNGNYSAYERQRAERLAQQQANYKKQQEQIAHMEDFVRRFRAKATKAKQAQSRLKALQRMELIAPAHVDSPFNFQFPVPEKLPETLLTLSETAIGYDKPLAEKINLSLLNSTRLGLLGANGNGKSTLIKTLAGSQSLLAGERHVSPHLKIGYFAQHQMNALRLDESTIEHLAALNKQASEQELRDFIGGFDFRGDRAFEPIRHFSGGEKARLALALVAWQKPNVLLLDEPTNHLDLEMRQALTVALQDFPGAIVLVSHDRHLLRNTVDEFLLVDGGKVETFAGDLEDYEQRLQGVSAKTVVADIKPAAKTDKKVNRQQAAAQREQLKPHRTRLRELEKSIDRLQRKVTAVDEQLADPELYETPSDNLQSLLREQGQLRQALTEAEEQWLNVSETLERLQDENMG